MSLQVKDDNTRARAVAMVAKQRMNTWIAILQQQQGNFTKVKAVKDLHHEVDHSKKYRDSLLHIPNKIGRLRIRVAKLKKDNQKLEEEVSFISKSLLHSGTFGVEYKNWHLPEYVAKRAECARWFMNFFNWCIEVLLVLN